MLGVCSFISNSDRLILGTYVRDQRMYLFFKERKRSNDDYKFLCKISQLPTLSHGQASIVSCFA